MSYLVVSNRYKLLFLRHANLVWRNLLDPVGHRSGSDLRSRAADRKDFVTLDLQKSELAGHFAAKFGVGKLEKVVESVYNFVWNKNHMTAIVVKITIRSMHITLVQDRIVKNISW
jgi:hypothetical protein